MRPIAHAILVVASAATLTATSPQTEFMAAQQANKAALREYTWKSRTELRLNGETRKVMLEQVRYDIDGAVQNTQIGGTDPAAEQSGGPGSRGGPLRQRIVARKKEEFKELMGELAALAGSYAHLPAGTLETFARHATISKGEGREAGMVRIHGSNVLAPRDSMTVWVDPGSYVMRRVEIVTAHEMNPVDIAVDYRSLDNGLTYQARSILRYPEKQIELTVENFEYRHVGALQ